MVPFEILSRYPNNDSFLCFREHAQGIIDKVFTVEFMILFASIRHFLRALFYWIFRFWLYLLLFSLSMPCCNGLLMRYEKQLALLSHHFWLACSLASVENYWNLWRWYYEFFQKFRVFWWFFEVIFEFFW